MNCNIKDFINFQKVYEKTPQTTSWNVVRRLRALAKNTKATLKLREKKKKQIADAKDKVNEMEIKKKELEEQQRKIKVRHAIMKINYLNKGIEAIKLGLQGTTLAHLDIHTLLNCDFTDFKTYETLYKKGKPGVPWNTIKKIREAFNKKTRLNLGIVPKLPETHPP